MSWDVQAVVQSRRFKSSTQKCLMIAMASYASDDGSGIWASQDSLADFIGVSRRTIGRTLKELKEQNLIRFVEWRTTVAGNAATANYTIILGNLEALPLTRTAKKKLNRIGTRRPNPFRDCDNEGIGIETECPTDHYGKPLSTTTVSANELFSLLMEAAGDTVDERNQAIAIKKEPLAWLSAKDPPDLHLDIIPTIARLSKGRRARSIKSWRFYRDAIFEARDFRLSNSDISDETKHANSNRNNQRGPDGSKYSSLDNATEAAIRRAQQNAT